jgi:lipoyl(octanoyl) transferase
MRRTDEAADAYGRLTAPSRTWRLLLEPEGCSGAVNMAADQALLDEAIQSGTATLRLYRWDPPCLSFGRNESTASYDRAQIERLGVDVVRRPTGGSAVWHEHEVTYAVAAPIEQFGSLRASYCAIHERIAVALRSLGADVSLAPDRRLTRPPPHRTAASPDRHGPCFNASVGGEILAGGRKLVGSAQVRKRGAFLQHGSILLSGSQDMIAAVSFQPSAVRHATTLSEAVSRPVTFDEVAAAIVRAWGEPLTSTAFDRPRPSSTVAPSRT